WDLRRGRRRNRCPLDRCGVREQASRWGRGAQPNRSVRGGEPEPAEHGARMVQAHDERTEVLTPYVPRLLLSWVADGLDDAYREVEGTLVFVDISGFTKLSERLAKLGK